MLRCQDSAGQSLIVTSGNFTGPGMSQNVEASVLLGSDVLTTAAFSWNQLIASLSTQAWLLYRLTHTNLLDPGWGLLYDESPVSHSSIERKGYLSCDSEASLRYGTHSDRSQDLVQRLGSQYFWLSKDCFDFFPPLTIRNERGYKGTLLAIISLHYCDLDVTDTACRVTFEAENNLDFNLAQAACAIASWQRPAILRAYSA